MKLRRNEEKKSLNIDLLLPHFFDWLCILNTRALLSSKEHLSQDGELQIFLEHLQLSFLSRHCYFLP